MEDYKKFTDVVQQMFFKKPNTRRGVIKDAIIGDVASAILEKLKIGYAKFKEWISGLGGK